MFETFFYFSLNTSIYKVYRGLCSTTFKERYNVHKEGFSHRAYSKGCELAKYIWELKDSLKTFDLKWKILEQVKGRMIGVQCKLCTTETMLINEHPNKDNLLNQTSIQKCRHENKYMISRYGDKRRTHVIRTDRNNPD